MKPARLTTLLAPIAATFLAAIPALANIEWTGASEESVKYWDDAANWDGTDEPHRVNVAEMKGAAVEINFRTQAEQTGQIWIENNLSGVVTFKGDDSTCGLLQKSGDTFVGTVTYGSLAVDGGTHHFANDIILGNGTWNANARGDFVLESGRVETHYWMVFGYGSKTGATGNATVKGGELVIGFRDGAEADNGAIDMGRAAYSVATFTQTGGSVSSQSGGSAGDYALTIGTAANSSAVYTISNGTYTARAGNIAIALGDGSTGTLNAHGGTVAAAAIVAGSGTATLSLDGGTLSATGDGVFIVEGVTLAIGANGGTIDTNGHDIEIAATVTGGGKVTIAGGGKVVFTQPVELSGDTAFNLSGGTLAFTSVTAQGALAFAGAGDVAVAGDVYASGTLAFTPDAASDATLAAGHTLKLAAQTVKAGAIEGGATIETTGGILTGGGTFYGNATGQGGLAIRGTCELQGVNTLEGDISLESGTMTFTSRMDDMTNIQFAFDASDTSTFTMDEAGNVSKFCGRGQPSNRPFNLKSGAAAAVYCTGDDAHFGGKPYLQFSGSEYLYSSAIRAHSYIAVAHPDANAGNLVYYNNQDYLGYDNGNWSLRTYSARYNSHVFQNGTSSLAWASGADTVVAGMKRITTNNNRGDSVGTGFTGAIAEIAGFSSAISIEDRIACERALMEKWNLAAAKSFPVLPATANFTMASGAVLDLGGLDLTVKSFAGAGTVKNGTLRTADNTFTQANGALTIPAIDGAVYVASSSLEKLTIASGEGKSVTVKLPSGWLEDGTNAHAIFCEGDVTFEFDGWEPEGEPYRMDNGWWHLYDTEEDADAELDAELARQDAEFDTETGLAFPGARGWGRFAKGARASSSPVVYHVTNLNDKGAGSLRDAVSKSGRIVVFDVSGVIKISSRVTFASNLYIAGHTAPGEGITVYGDGCSFSGANNIICRYLRWRMGKGGTSGKDCAGVANGTNMIFDHCSFSWGLDETFSINPDGKGDLGNITLQNCIFGQGLLTHSAGGLMQADCITLYRNFYCDNSTRNNKMKGKIQYCNNVVYDWKNGCVIMGGDSSGTSYVNLEGNLFINGPATGTGNALGGGNSDFHFYGNDNWQDRNKNGTFDPECIDAKQTGGGDKVEERYDYPGLALYPGDRLLDKNIPTVGASLPYRDQSDCYMVDEVMSCGTKGALLAYESSLPIGTPSQWDWWTGEERTDTDGDGIPDDWETAHGLDPNNAADALAKTLDPAYLNIEVYLNSITAADRQFFLRRPITPGSSARTQTSITVTWRDYTEGEDGFEIEVAKYGTSSWSVAATTEANATSCEVAGLDSGTYYNVRIRAFATVDGEKQYSEYSKTVRLYTSLSDTPEVDIDTYEPDVTHGKGNFTWNKSDATWDEGISFKDGFKVLLANNSSGSPTVTIAEAVEPASVVVNGSGYTTLAAQGNLGGSDCALVKGNTGTLILSGANTYAGATINHGGMISFDSIANGGTASAIGKSQSFPDNWIFDGGTYRYTGGSASTDRNAIIRNDSALQIKNSATTLAVSGAFEGDGGLSIQGEGTSGGTLSVADASFFGYSGATAIRNGATVYLSSVEGSAKTFNPSQLVLGGGTLKFNYKSDDYQTHSFPIELEEGTTSYIDAPSHGYFKCRLTGTGTLQFNLPWTREYIDSNLTEFEGTLIGSGSGQVFMPQKSWNAPLARFYLKNGIKMSAWDTNADNYLGGLSGDAGTYLYGSSKNTVNHKCSWTVGSANTDETFAGIINNLPAGGNSAYSGSTSITKVGTGIWRLTGKNVHSGATTVNGGALIINGTHPASSAVTVNDGGTLRGEGTIAAAVTVNAGGVLSPGDETTDSSASGLVLSGGVTIKSGARLKFVLGRDGSGKPCTYRMRPSGTFKIESGAILAFDLSATGDLAAGDSISLMSLLPTFSGEFDSSLIEPAVPGKGLKWDTSNLYSNKTIAVIADPDYVDSEIDPAAPQAVTVSAASESEAYTAITVKRPKGAESAVEADSYKAYFDFGYTDNGDGTFTVVLDGVKAEVVEETIAAAAAQMKPGATEITVPVKPGLYYGFTPGDTLPLPAPDMNLATGDTESVAMPGGDTGFLRIDISATPQ